MSIKALWKPFRSDISLLLAWNFGTQMAIALISTRCLSRPCGSHSAFRSDLYLPWAWNFGTQMAIALIPRSMQQNMEWPLHFPTTTAFHIHMHPTNSAWSSRCLSRPCGSHSGVIYLPWAWNFGTKMAIAPTKIHATKHGMASQFSNYHCISHPYASNKQCLMV